jgi:hypothetical protein
LVTHSGFSSAAPFFPPVPELEGPVCEGWVAQADISTIAAAANKIRNTIFISLSFLFMRNINIKSTAPLPIFHETQSK